MYVIVAGFCSLREAQKSALLSELHLVLAKVSPVPQLRGFIVGCVRLAACGADALELHENVQESVQVLLCLNLQLALSLFGHVEQCARDGANLHGLR